MLQTKRPPISYYGGKQLMSKHILPNIPEHTTYVETFAGGAAIFWLKEQSKVEFLNDTNKEIINFYQVLKSNFDALQDKINLSLYSRDLHRQAWTIYSNSDMFTHVERAWAFWILSVQGFGGMITSSWGRDKTQNKAIKTFNNRKKEFISEYENLLQNVELESRDAIKLITGTDYKDAFFYCDPPYYNSNMGHYNGYTIEDFELLLQTLGSIKGKFMLSSYPSKILKEFTKKNGWHSFEIELNVNISNKGKRKTEVITANYELKKQTNSN